MSGSDTEGIYLLSRISMFKERICQEDLSILPDMVGRCECLADRHQMNVG